jgi:hypothetical protein
MNYYSDYSFPVCNKTISEMIVCLNEDNKINYFKPNVFKDFLISKEEMVI